MFYVSEIQTKSPSHFQTRLQELVYEVLGKLQMFKTRKEITLYGYGIQYLLLAEKLETIMARGTANTYMRDFYDIHIILHQDQIDSDMLCKVFLATSQKRKS